MDETRGGALKVGWGYPTSCLYHDTAPAQPPCTRSSDDENTDRTGREGARSWHFGRPSLCTRLPTCPPSFAARPSAEYILWMDLFTIFVLTGLESAHTMAAVVVVVVGVY